MKWVFYVIVFIYMFYRAVYGVKEINIVSIEPVNYGKDKNYLEVGAKKTITCRVIGKNQKVEWLNPDGDVVKHENTNRVFSQKHLIPSHGGTRVPALLLTINSAEVDDSGKYTCRTEKISKEVELCVISPSDFVDTPTEIFVDEGRSFTLTCQAQGNPEPRLMWSRDGVNIDEDNNSSKYKVMTKYNRKGFESLLTITSLEPEDSGTYTCVAIQENVLVENCILSKFLNVSVQVNYPPTFLDNQDTQLVFARYNESLELVCAANGFPEPTYRWFHDAGNNTLFEYPHQQIKHSEDGSEAKLPVIANSITFGQKFTCRVTNDLGERLKIFTIIKLEKPEPPNEVNFIYQGPDEIVFNFTSDVELMYPIDRMEVQYFRADESPMKKKSQRDKDSEWRKARLTELELTEEFPEGFRLKDLDVDTSYWMRFRATNELGTSSWSKPHLASTSPQTTTEVATTDETSDDEELATSSDGPDELETYSSGTFFGIFFAGGIFILVAVGMFLMRMV